MAPRIISTKKNQNIIFKNSPCVVTMENWDAENNDTTSLAGLGLKKNCDVVIQDGEYVEIGQNASVKYSQDHSFEVIDASELILLPGLIDSHTHPLFSGSRANETVLKSQGLGYEEIAAQGGGIQSTVLQTRAASLENLVEKYKIRALQALEKGVVVWEAKTGYGLNPKEEMKCLTALYQAHKNDLDHELPGLVPTYLGPHAASPECSGLNNYIEQLIAEIPNISALNDEALAGGYAHPLAADIFIERNYFTKENGQLWLGSALQYGLDVHIHADEFSRSGGSELAIELAKRAEQTKEKRRDRGRVLSVDHCQYATETDLSRLASLGVTAVALPMTSFFSKIPYVQADKWRSSGVRAAIASDFNPGTAPVNNLWFAAYLSLSHCFFSLPEVIAGVTLNAAYAVGLEKKYGKMICKRKASCIAIEGFKIEDFFASPVGEHVRIIVH